MVIFAAKTVEVFYYLYLVVLDALCSKSNSLFFLLLQAVVQSKPALPLQPLDLLHSVDLDREDSEEEEEEEVEATLSALLRLELRHPTNSPLKCCSGGLKQAGTSG